MLESQILDNLGRKLLVMEEQAGVVGEYSTCGLPNRMDGVFVNAVRSAQPFLSSTTASLAAPCDASIFKKVSRYSDRNPMAQTFARADTVSSLPYFHGVGSSIDSNGGIL
jgi:hypothetical protein